MMTSLLNHNEVDAMIEEKMIEKEVDQEIVIEKMIEDIMMDMIEEEAMKDHEGNVIYMTHTV